VAVPAPETLDRDCAGNRGRTRARALLAEVEPHTNGEREYRCREDAQMVVTHEPWIVALSVLVAVQGSFVGLKIMLGLPDASSGGRRRFLLAGAAVTLAVAIWSMHFVGMLAVRSSVRIDFLLFPTIVSLLLCVLVVGLAVYLASTAPSSNSLLAV